MHTDPNAKRTQCIRCGECCLGAAPSLQLRDLLRVTKGPIRRSDLYTVRLGELVRDNIQGKLRITEEEIIKVKEKEGRGGCIFYDDRGRCCTIYERRPVQCAAMACWDSTQFIQVYSEPKATRKDIIHDTNLLRLMAAHEETCGYAALDRHVREIEPAGEQAIHRILKILRFDHDIRMLTREKLGVDAGEMDLIFGRPLTETIPMFGLKVIREPDGSFLLTPKDSLHPP